MQNKPNFLDTQMNITSVTITDYKEKHPSSHPQNKPNSNPIGSYAQNEHNLLFNKELRRKASFQTPRKQTQFKANQTQFAGQKKTQKIHCFSLQCHTVVTLPELTIDLAAVSGEILNSNFFAHLTET